MTQITYYYYLFRVKKKIVYLYICLITAADPIHKLTTENKKPWFKVASFLIRKCLPRSNTELAQNY